MRTQTCNFLHQYPKIINIGVTLPTGTEMFRKERREKKRGWCRIFTKYFYPKGYYFLSPWCSAFLTSIFLRPIFYRGIDLFETFCEKNLIIKPLKLVNLLKYEKTSSGIKGFKPRQRQQTLERILLNGFHFFLVKLKILR